MFLEHRYNARVWGRGSDIMKGYFSATRGLGTDGIMPHAVLPSVAQLINFPRAINTDSNGTRAGLQASLV